MMNHLAERMHNMKNVWVMKESTQSNAKENPRRWYFTSLKKAMKHAEFLLICDGFTDKVKFEPKKYHSFVTGDKGDTFKMFFITREHVS